MTVLYDNRQRAKRARYSIVTAVVWSIGWFYWASVLWTGGTRPLAVAIVVIIGFLPMVVLHFYGNVYVVRIVRDGDMVDISTLGLIGYRTVRVPLSAILEIAKPEDAGMTIRVAGRRTPFLLDLQAEYSDMNAITALGGRNAALGS